MQHTGAAEPLRRRPDENECIVGPGLFAARIAKSAVKIDNRFSILPNRNRRAEFTQPFEIVLEEGSRRVRSLSALGCTHPG
jgi:hypothetical protein